jgi:hypothetical protein
MSLSGSGLLTIDPEGINPGNWTAPALKFGGESASEGITSARTGTGNVNGLDFFTGTNSRMQITALGNVGVGTVSSLNSKVNPASAGTSARFNVQHATTDDTESTVSLSNAIAANSTTRIDFWSFLSNKAYIQFNNNAYTGIGGINSLVIGTNSSVSDLHLATSGTTNANIRMTIDRNGAILMKNIPTFANDAAAGAGLVVQDQLYKTATGQLMIKL